MAAELIIVPEAQQDVDEAYSWYEDRRPALGEEFLSCVDACIQTIRRIPELYAKVHKEYRRALVRPKTMSLSIPHAQTTLPDVNNLYFQTPNMAGDKPHRYFS